MAYTLEFLPDEKRVKYIIPGYRGITPSIIVTNDDQSVKLFKYHTNIDNPKEEYFAIVYENQVYRVCLTKSFDDKSTVRWRAIYKYDLPDNVLQELREAMKIYKGMGNPFVPCDRSAKVVIDF